ncbi:protein tyrosine/serine phosphatase [Nonlabens ulvanivorans]|nr:protein tyrosine/serine phosphatase [Nonlabens ulvanivorans]
MRNDSTKARGTDLELIHLPLQTKKIKESDIIMALKAIVEAPKPLLIHCWHGSDRTGVVVAAYRMVCENWSTEKAIAEFRQKEYGYHERWYPHLIGILENLDTIAVKQELGLE